MELRKNLGKRPESSSSEDRLLKKSRLDPSASSSPSAERPMESLIQLKDENINLEIDKRVENLIYILDKEAGQTDPTLKKSNLNKLVAFLKRTSEPEIEKYEQQQAHFREQSENFGNKVKLTEKAQKELERNKSTLLPEESFKEQNEELTKSKDFFFSKKQIFEEKKSACIKKQSLLRETKMLIAGTPELKDQLKGLRHLTRQFEVLKKADQTIGKWDRYLEEGEEIKQTIQNLSHAGGEGSSELTDKQKNLLENKQHDAKRWMNFYKKKYRLYTDRLDSHDPSLPEDKKQLKLDALSKQMLALTNAKQALKALEECPQIQAAHSIEEEDNNILDESRIDFYLREYEVHMDEVDCHDPSLPGDERQLKLDALKKQKEALTNAKQAFNKWSELTRALNDDALFYKDKYGTFIDEVECYDPLLSEEEKQMKLAPIHKRLQVLKEEEEASSKLSDCAQQEEELSKRDEEMKRSSKLYKILSPVNRQWR